MIWNKEKSHNISDGFNYWAIGNINQDVQYSIFATAYGWQLKTSFKDGNNTNSIGHFKDLEKVKNVAQMIDEG